MKYTEIIKETSDKICLVSLFEFLDFRKIYSYSNYLMYKQMHKYYVIIYTGKGYLYYDTCNPTKKKNAYDLIYEFCKRKEIKNHSIWKKVEIISEKYIKSTENYVQQKNHLELSSESFNHFLLLLNSNFLKLNEGCSSKTLGELYVTCAASEAFKNKLFYNTKDSSFYFPLYNDENQVSGFMISNEKSITENDNTNKFYESSNISSSIWYSNIPEKLDSIMIFNNPIEALSFYYKFQLKNIVYVVLSDINAKTSDILKGIQSLLSSKKIISSLTGSYKIDGYRLDLRLSNYYSNNNFSLSSYELNTIISFKSNLKDFGKFYKYIKTYNDSLSQNCKEYSFIYNQLEVDENSIFIERNDSNVVKIKLPFDTNSLKYFVWAYYKVFLSKYIEILKPISNSWFEDYCNYVLIKSEIANELNNDKELLLENYKLQVAV